MKLIFGNTGLNNMQGNLINKKITIITSSDFPYGGAPENFVRLLSLGLISHGCTVNIKLFRGSRRKETSKSLNEKIKISHVLFKNRKNSEFIKAIEILLLFIITPLALIKEKLVFKPKYILIYGIEYFYYLLPILLISKLLNIKIIRIVTDLYPETTISPSWWKKAKVFFYRFQFKKFDRYFSGMLYLSNYLQYKAIENKVKNIIVIPHFINLDQFFIARSPIINSEKIRFGYCGSINEENGIFDLLEAFDILSNKVKNAELLIIGSTNKLSPIKKEKFDLLVEKKKNKIILAGQIAYNDIAKWLGTCDVLVNPRPEDERAKAGFPTKLGEYLACKKAVITTKVGDIPLYFKNNIHVVLAKPNSPKDIADKMQFVIDNPNEAKVIAKNGYQWANENLNYINSAGKLIKFLEKL